MLRPQRNTQIPLRNRSKSPPRFEQAHKKPKRRRIDPVAIDRNNVDQALAVIEAASECTDELPTLLLTELPQFEANYVQNRAGSSKYSGLSESGFFELLFSPIVIEIISEETNSYVESHLRDPLFTLSENCHWVPTTPAEIRVHLGIHLYFGLYQLAARSDYWRIHKLGKFMGRDRFQFIHRLFSLNAAPAQPNAPWFYRIERVADLIRTACRDAYVPSSHITIDEAMVAFEGRSNHTVKLKNKPISDGYKLWCIGDHGYIWSWLFHSKTDGVETFTKSQQTQWPQQQGTGANSNTEKSALLAPTYALVLRLATQLPKRKFCIYLDNLFLNILVAQCLLTMGIYCMGTTRKKAAGVPLQLQRYLNDNSELLWDSTIAQVIDNNTLAFIWQDNKAVCALTTAHSLHRIEDRIQRTRRCPKISSENRRILDSVFKGLPFKDLFIPRAIDDYNHHMKGVDQADQLRAAFTCHRKQNYRTQWPLIYFLIDVARVNAYLLWLWSSETHTASAKRTHNTHRDFVEALCSQLLHSDDKTKEEEDSHSLPTMVLQRHHKHIQKKSYGRCQWGKLHPPGCTRKRAPKRAFGTDLTKSANNGISSAILGGSKTHYECSKCQVWICIEGDCWIQYHHSIGVNC